MSSVFMFTGGGSDPIYKHISDTAANVIVDTTGITTGGNRHVAWFQVNEASNGTPTITVDLYKPADGSLRYLGAGGFTWKSKAMTAYQSLEFTNGYDVPLGWQLRVTISAGTADVIGIAIGRN